MKLKRMPFFDPTRPAYREDPYPSLARLRREEPVHFSRQLQAWVLTSYEHCARVLQDDGTFSSEIDVATGSAGKAFAERRRAAPLGDVAVLSNSDPPAHTRLRSVVSRAFTPRALEAMRPRVEARITELLDEAGDTLEVVNGLAAPLVTSIILEQIGVPAEDHEAFRGLTIGIMLAHSGDPARLPAARKAHGDLIAMVERWQRDRGVAETSVLGSILAAPDNEAVTADEMLMLLINIALSGNGATINGIGNAILALAQNPEALDAFARGPEPFPAAIDELLRYDSPAHIVSRVAREPQSLGGRNVRAGDVLHVVLGAANRDPARFPDPDSIDLAREDNRHLVFGYAAHFCLGAPLARIQIESAVRALLARYGRFRVAEVVRGDSILMRGPTRLTILRAPEV
ncbi:cytochrome P450 [bacterium]|nr:cytochrome P450 [bacterium]